MLERFHLVLLHLLENTFDRKRISAKLNPNLNSNLNPKAKAQYCFQNDVIFRESVQYLIFTSQDLGFCLLPRHDCTVHTHFYTCIAYIPLSLNRVLLLIQNWLNFETKILNSFINKFVSVMSFSVEFGWFKKKSSLSTNQFSDIKRNCININFNKSDAFVLNVWNRFFR